MFTLAHTTLKMCPDFSPNESSMSKGYTFKFGGIVTNGSGVILISVGLGLLSKYMVSILLSF